MLPVGTIVYTLGNPPVHGTGLSWTAEEADVAVKGPVASVVYDDVGTQFLTSLLNDLSETGFTNTNVQAMLSQTRDVENWRVGEALAESYLAHHRDCHFPWPNSRDIRKSGSSLPGADLVGFQRDGQHHRFVFGEVKTSNDKQCPPRACYGVTGLKQQLEDLRNDLSIRKDLVRYLTFRSENAEWKDQFLTAARRYIANNNDIRVFGILVRDVMPNENDLQTRVASLSKGCPAQMTIELLAIYLPEKSIENLGALIVQSRKEGGA